MTKKINAKKFLALLLSLAVFLAALPAFSVFADGVVTFTAQTTADGFKNDVILTRDPGTITMPSLSSDGTDLRTGWRASSDMRPGNCEVSGWLYNGKYYAVGEVVNNVPAGASFTAVYGNKSINFNELPTNFTIYGGNTAVSYGSPGVTIAQVSEGNNCLQFVGQSGDSSNTKRQGAMVYNSNYAVCYTAGAKYKVTFKYRRTDNLSASADIYLVFGTYLYSWYPESKAVQTNKLVTTKSNMSEFETVTAVVTAPDTYTNSNESYASKAMGFRVGTPAEGVTIQIDDISVETSLGREYAAFSYGSGNGIVGTDTIEIVDNDGNITLPTNDTAMNLYWSHDGRLFNAGETVSVDSLVKNGSGYYPFTAKFGTVSVDYDEIDTDPFTFITGSGPQTKDSFFEQLNKNDWWGIPAGYGNDGNKTAFGGSVLGIIKRSGVSESGNNLYLKPWQDGYYNAALFTHTPFDANDANSHNSNASGTVNYKYAYFTPGEQYTLTFDYMLDTTAGGNPPYTVSIAFGMDTKNGNANCGQKTIEYADGTISRTGVDLGTDNKVWKRAAITLTAPASYTGNDITSGRVGISIKAKVGTALYIDNVELRLEGPVEFSYGNATGTSQAVGFDTTAHINGDGTITLPVNENAMNLLWENGGKLYVPGTNVSAESLGNDLTFDAYFGGAKLDYENIYTGNISMADGEKTQNVYQSLSRNNDYWRLPKGLSNTTASSSGYYGLALGHDRMGITSDAGKSGKGLKFRTNANGAVNLYRSAALFRHDPTTFNASSNITYSYAYYAPSTQYTIEFDYKTNSEVSATIAFGVNPTAEFDETLQSTTVNSLGGEGTYITLPATNGSWGHASVTVTSPSSYTGNGITSARVGIALKDNDAAISEIRYNYFDNVEFYPTQMATMQFVYDGSDEGFTDSSVVTHLAAGDTTPTKNSTVATRRFGSGWQASYGHIAIEGWLCNETGQFFGLGDLITGVPANATFKAVFGNETFDFDDLSNEFSIYNADNTSYGSEDVSINGSENKYVTISSSDPEDSMKYSQFIPVSKVNDSYVAAGFTRDAHYKVTFKYKRTDNTDVNSDIYVSFGALAYYWRAEKQCVEKIKVATTKKNMSQYETVTAYLTAPASYAFDEGESETFASRAIGFGATISNGVSIDFDDFSIVSSLGSSYVTFDENIGDNVISHRIVSYGTAVTDLPAPTYEGFDFCGWYSNRMGTGEAATSIMPHSAQETYYAKWVPTLSGNTGAVTINGNALSNYQLELPSNKTLVLADSLSAFKTLMLAKGAVTSSKSLKITVEDTSSKTISSGESSYTIKVENNNLVVTATDDAAMSGALDRLSQFVSTAYAKNKTLNFASDFEFTQNYVPDDSQYSYTWSDEFNSEDLDKSIWLKKANYKAPEVNGYQIGENNWFTGDPDEGNDETGRYTINNRGIFVNNGSAVVRAEKVDASDAAGNSHYFINRSMSTIGSVEYLYGCIEIKAKLPAHPAAPQIWLYSSQDVATSSEIDLHEGIGQVSGYANNQQIVSNIHASYHLTSDANRWKTSLDSNQPLNSSSSPRIYLGSSKTNFDNAYHIYSVKWTPDEIALAIDGEVYYTYNLNTSTDLINNATNYAGTSPFAGLTAQQIKECFSKQMYINIGNVMGTIEGEYGPVYVNGDPAQADLLVDYVRIYQSSSNEGSSFKNKPYTVSKIAEVEQDINSFISTNGIENRGATTKTVTMSATGLATETLKINLGDTLPVNYKVGDKYIIGWTDGTNNVKTYKDSSKTYTPKFIDVNMLDVKYKVSATSGGNANLLFTSTVESQWSTEYTKAGFIYSTTNNDPVMGSSGCTKVETTKVYEDGLFANKTSMLNCTGAGYTGYSTKMFNFALSDIAMSGRANNIYVRSYVVLTDGRVVYGDLLTIAAATVLSDNVSAAFDEFIIERLAGGAKLDNIADYNSDGTTNIIDLVRVKRMAAEERQTSGEVVIMAGTLTNVGNVLLTYNLNCVK